MWPEVSVMEIKTPGASRCGVRRCGQIGAIMKCGWCGPGTWDIPASPQPSSAQPRTLDQDLFLAAAWAWPGPALGRGHINMMTVIKLTLFFSTLAHISILTLAMFEEYPEW